jgi:N-acetylglucosaminyl-diphospho-decaprenol L-rhamnosyltransferase
MSVTTSSPSSATASSTAAETSAAPVGLTVVIPHHGAPEPTRRLAGSLLTCAGERPVQVIVVDDASPQPFPDTDGVEVVRRDTNGGFGAAVNSGAALARHPMLLVLNSDVAIYAKFVDELLTAAEPWMPAVVGPLVFDAVGRVAPSARRFPTITQQAVEWLTPLARWRQTKALRWAIGHDVRCEPDTVRPVDWVIGAAMLLPTAEFEAAGGFDPGYFMNCEEVDLQRRLHERGVPSVFLGTVRLIHLGGGSSDPDVKRQWLVSSRLRDMRATRGTAAAVWLAVVLGMASLVNFGFNLARQRAGRPVDAYFELRRELGMIRHARTRRGQAG